MRTILVTGGAGFIGSAVVREIIQHTADRVVVVDKLTYAGNLMSLAPVAQDVDALAVLGLTLLDRHQQDKPLSRAEAEQAQRRLDAAAQTRDEVVIAAVYPLEALLRGLKTE